MKLLLLTSALFSIPPATAALGSGRLPRTLSAPIKTLSLNTKKPASRAGSLFCTRLHHSFSFFALSFSDQPFPPLLLFQPLA